MDTRKWTLGFGAVLLLAASAQGADPAAGKSEGVAQAGPPRFRTFEGRFGDADRPRPRMGDADHKGPARQKPDLRRRDDQHRSARPGEQVSKKGDPAAKKKDGPQHRRPEWARDGGPDWKSRWKSDSASFQGRKPGPGAPGPFAGRHGGSRFDNKYAAASWRGPHRHQGHGQMGRHCGSGRCAFASMHGSRHHKHGGLGHYAHGRHRGHGHARHAHDGHHRGYHGRYAAGDQHGHCACPCHRGFQHGAFAARGGHGCFGRHMAMGRMAAMRWHQRGFDPGQFGRREHGFQGHGSHGFAMNPWMMRSQWQGFGPGPMARGSQAGSAPRQFQRPWEAPVRPAGMPGRGPQTRGGGEGDARLAELSARVERLQRELERLRREVR